MKLSVILILILGVATRTGWTDQLPRLHGSWQASTASPHVFDTPEEIRATAAATREAGSYTAQKWGRLASEVKSYTQAKIDWGATYSGCDLDLYQRAFSFSSSGGYASETRSDAQMTAAMHPAGGTSPPRGAAIVAANLAMYASLVHAGAAHIVGAPSEGEAAALSRKILLAWGNHGFRSRGEQFRVRPTDYCGTNPQDNIIGDVGLQVGRGAIQYVQAQDLLTSLHTLSKQDDHALAPFDLALFNIVRNSANYDSGPQFRHGDRDCGLYTNGHAMHLLALMAIARLHNRGEWMEEILYGGVRGAPEVTIPWVELFDRAVYGEHDKPVSCYPNTGKDRLASKPSFQSGRVAPGEIADRYRNANPAQGVGYPMFTLQDLYFSAIILRNSGFDAFHYKGRHGQSIEQATDYYGCFARNVGFNKEITAQNARACPNSQEYVGQRVEAVEGNVIMGAEAFPEDALLHRLLPEAEALPGDGEVTGLMFGHWPK